ncbi:MAG: Regulatory protein RecX [Firmicutes bacterium]|nr:Regulatory protein RecX [candidate division NPL-UPA2 bacterium]MBT9155584.1 Regulatory protein RecX [candidate division NPL-UPA2 bacterium]
MKNSDLRQTALRILARRDHTQRELYDKLLQRGFLPQDVSALCQEFVQQGYLDDRRVAASLLESATGRASTGAKLFRKRLLERGLPPELVEGTVAAYEEQTEALAPAMRLALQLHARGKDGAFIQRHLWRKGFSAQDIRTALRELEGTCIDNGQAEG